MYFSLLRANEPVACAPRTIRGVTTLLDIAGIQLEVEELLGVPVDVLTPSALPEKFRDQVLREAVPVRSVCL